MGSIRARIGILCCRRCHHCCCEGRCCVRFPAFGTELTIIGRLCTRIGRGGTAVCGTIGSRGLRLLRTNVLKKIRTNPNQSAATEPNMPKKGSRGVRRRSREENDYCVPRFWPGSKKKKRWEKKNLCDTTYCRMTHLLRCCCHGYAQKVLSCRSCTHLRHSAQNTRCGSTCASSGSARR